METRPLVAWVCLLQFLHQGDYEWLTPCPLERHSGAMRSFPWWPEPALPLPFSSKVRLLVFATTKERPFNPLYKSVPPSLLYHSLTKTSNKFYQRALNIITFWWFLQAWKQFLCLNISLRRFPFVRSDRPDHSSHNENFTVNQNCQSDPKQQAQRKWCFNKSYWKKVFFIVKMTGAGCGPAGQFWFLESALKKVYDYVQWAVNQTQRTNNKRFEYFEE